MTTDQLSDMLVARLVRDHGGAKHAWRRLVGRVRLYSVATHPHCNWAIDPTGSIAQIATIERLLDDLRLRYPILSA